MPLWNPNLGTFTLLLYPILAILSFWSFIIYHLCPFGMRKWCPFRIPVLGMSLLDCQNSALMPSWVPIFNTHGLLKCVNLVLMSIWSVILGQLCPFGMPKWCPFILPNLRMYAALECQTLAVMFVRCAKLWHLCAFGVPNLSTYALLDC